MKAIFRDIDLKFVPWDLQKYLQGFSPLEMQRKAANTRLEAERQKAMNQYITGMDSLCDLIS